MPGWGSSGSSGTSGHETEWDEWDEELEIREITGSRVKLLMSDGNSDSALGSSGWLPHEDMQLRVRWRGSHVLALVSMKKMPLSFAYDSASCPPQDEAQISHMLAHGVHAVAH